MKQRKRTAYGWKRFLAGLLTGVMLSSQALPGMSLTAFATELSSENLGNGTSEATAWGWINKGSTGDGGAAGYRFNLCGYKTMNQMPGNPYLESNSDRVQTTYGWGGFPTWIMTTGSTATPGVSGASATRVNQASTHGMVVTYGALGVETKIAVSASKDGKYVLVDYYVYDNGTMSASAGRWFHMGSGADIQIDGNDAAPLSRNSRGVHMVNPSSQAVFDCIMDDPGMNLTPPDRVWLGNYSAYLANLFNNQPAPYSVSGIDSGYAYSWSFLLRPYELVHKRIAFAIRNTSYYVSSANGQDAAGRSGDYSAPFKTIDYALQRIGAKVGYIYVMDYDLISAPINVNTANQNVTISSSDFNSAGTPLTGTAGYMQTLKRAGGYTGSIFQVSNGNVKFTDVVLDGNNVATTSPLLYTSAGTLEINSGAVVQNCNGSAAGNASAIEVAGGNFFMNYGTIKNNVSNGKGAVYFNGTAFTVQNKVDIKDNKTSANVQNNVYLASGKYISVKGDLEDGKIGVTTQVSPAVSQGGSSTAAGQEVIVAAPDASYSVSGTCTFSENFVSDKEDTENVYISIGTDVLGNLSKTVLKRNGSTITTSYQEIVTGGVVVGAPASVSTLYPSGEAIAPIAPPAAIPGYTLSEVVIDQGSSASLTWNNVAGAAFGTISGIMPDQDVSVTYRYTRNVASIVYVTNGGTPQPNSISGSVGDSVSGILPFVSKYGYVFNGWSEDVPPNASPAWVTALPATLPDQALTYYAYYLPNPAVKFDYTVEYVSQSGIIFQSTTTGDAYSVESPVQSQKKNIHGYVWKNAASGTSPAQYNYGSGSEDVGTFTVGGVYDGQFDGTMPGQDLAVSYGYAVDYSNPSAKSDLTVRYVSTSGNVIHTPVVTGYFPEDSVNVNPLTIYGYDLVDAQFAAGTVASSTDGNLVNAVSPTTFAGNGSYTGTMPNQPVEIIYTYQANGDGYTLSYNYHDNNTSDSNLIDIVAPETESRVADTAVTKAFTPLYGYIWGGNEADPSTAGAFDGSNDYAGTMPTEDLKVIWKYNRVPSKWALLTYQAGVNGSLTNGAGVSADVTSIGGGKYTASVLKDDGSAQGTTDSYTWNIIRQKRLVPVPQPASYYRFVNWFIDANDDGVKDPGENFLNGTERFTGPATLTAYFEEDPDQWIDISFAAGSHGSITSGAASLHIPYDKTWNDIQASLPSYAPETNYLVDGWYDSDTLMQLTDPLQDGHIYTIRFYPDPAIWGTNVAPPDASTGLNAAGKGKLTVYHTEMAYRYIVTDLNGIIVAVQGGISGGRIYFDNLYPGTRYQVYETAGTTAAVGDSIAAASGSISDPTEVLVPVVETNYQILPDENHEGKTVLVIKPADNRSDYAVLDNSGNLVAGWTAVESTTPPSVKFPGLEYSEEYIVVAIPRGITGITPESKEPDGSVIITNPGGELDIPNYTIRTLEGNVDEVDGQTIGTDSYDQAHKGDAVSISAPATNSAGEPFSHWRILIGAVPGMTGSITQRELSFTMPDANLVFAACYTRAPSVPSVANVVDEVRGGNANETALDPGDVPNLEQSLTTADDRTLIDVNGADVTYKVVYTRTSVKATESNAIKASADYNTDHVQAYKGAWGLEVDIERYVNGRKNPIPAVIPSGLTFTTHIQLGKNDIDMLDYQLFQIEDASGIITPQAVSVTPDPEQSGGLFTFTAEAGARYVLVYSKAFRLYFRNTVVPPGYQYYFKVRKEEAPSDGYYSTEYASVEDPDVYYLSPQGVEYNFEGWSYSEDSLKVFNPDRLIKQKTEVWAYYRNNQAEVEDERKKLEDAINEAKKIADDHFLKNDERQSVLDAIEDALDVLERTSPQATLDELINALQDLENVTNPIEQVLDDRYDHYGKQQNSGSKGGSSGGGGGKGSGVKTNPYVAEDARTYTVGINGNWELINESLHQWTFVLNGGIRLTNRWGKLNYQTGGMIRNGWYRFDEHGYIKSGWILENGTWYYLNPDHNGWFGEMKTGWHYDQADQKWYYFDLVTGAMATGWHNLGGKWYYFSPISNAENYRYDPATGTWVYQNTGKRPLGSLYMNETTPDGYSTGADGAWTQ